MIIIIIIIIIYIPTHRSPSTSCNVRTLYTHTNCQCILLPSLPLLYFGFCSPRYSITRQILYIFFIIILSLYSDIRVYVYTLLYYLYLVKNNDLFYRHTASFMPSPDRPTFREHRPQGSRRIRDRI